MCISLDFDKGKWRYSNILYLNTELLGVIWLKKFYQHWRKKKTESKNYKSFLIAQSPWDIYLICTMLSLIIQTGFIKINQFG